MNIWLWFIEPIKVIFFISAEYFYFGRNFKPKYKNSVEIKKIVRNFDRLYSQKLEHLARAWLVLNKDTKLIKLFTKDRKSFDAELTLKTPE